MKQALAAATLSLTALMTTAAGAQGDTKILSAADQCILDEFTQASTEAVEMYIENGYGSITTFYPESMGGGFVQYCENLTGTSATEATKHLQDNGFGIFVAPARDM